MKIHSANMLPLIVLTLLAALTFWLERATQVDSGANSDKLRHDPDSTIAKLTMRHFNQDGNLQHSLQADQLLHYPDDDSTHITEPALTFYAHAQPTRLSARQAIVTEEGKLVQLIGDARVVREASADSPELVLTTSAMDVYPDDEIARSSVPVTIVNGRNVVQGTAMEANHRTQTYTLMGRAKATIYKTQPQTP